MEDESGDPPPLKRIRTGAREDADDDVLFERARKRLEKAKQELALAQENMIQVRERIRANGNFAPDSMLRLSDGEGNHLLFAVMEFLDTEDIGRCEMTCRTLREQAKKCWDKFDQNLSDPTLRSPSAQDSRQRVVRYYLASSLAKRIGSMGNSISKHAVFLDRWNDLIGLREVDCCRGCNFPCELNLDVFYEDKVDDYELFVRFSRISDNYPFAEGFLPLIPLHDESTKMLEIPLDTMNFSKWPKLVEITRRVEDERERFDDDSLLHACMRELTATVVAINKTSSETSLVVAQCNFSGSAGSGEEAHEIDNMGDHGSCVPKGRLPSRPHDLNRSEGHDVALWMQFESTCRTDPEDSTRKVNECQWALYSDCQRYRVYVGREWDDE